MDICQHLVESVLVLRAEQFLVHVRVLHLAVLQQLHVVQLVEVEQTRKTFVAAVLILIMPIRVQVVQALQPIVCSSNRIVQTVVVQVLHNVARQRETTL